MREAAMGPAYSSSSYSSVLALALRPFACPVSYIVAKRKRTVTAPQTGTRNLWETDGIKAQREQQQASLEMFQLLLVRARIRALDGPWRKEVQLNILGTLANWLYPVSMLSGVGPSIFHVLGVAHRFYTCKLLASCMHGGAGGCGLDPRQHPRREKWVVENLLWMGEMKQDREGYLMKIVKGNS
jgi:hypothetical protein